jgi:glycosyltransferase involved in cell wall biosynthesis
MDVRRKGHRIDQGADADAGIVKGLLGLSQTREIAPDSHPLDRGDDARLSGEVVILIPAFNDWPSLAQLLPRLDSVLAAHGIAADVLIVDDGSTTEPDGVAAPRAFGALKRVDVLSLRRNLGHQRAIAIGLAYVEDCLRPGAVVLMDGDGEDDPADVPRLLERLKEEGDRKIVFAERSRRSESIRFRFFYLLFKLLHFILIGKGVRVGNFSVIPRRRLASLVVVAELWNHYAAAAFRSRQPYCMIPTRRGRRYCGDSTMNFVSLVTHGLSAISVYSDVVGVRLLVASFVMVLLTLLGILSAMVVRLATDWAVPGWASYVVGILFILMVQAIMAAFVFSFVILGSRHGSSFLPRRDYSFFIGSLWTIHRSTWSIAPLPVPEIAGLSPDRGGIAP